MRKRTWIFYGVILILLVIASGRARLVSTAIAQSSAPAPEVSLPIFEKDMAWPKALPNNYYIGQVSGISVDLGNNIWISQRPQGEKNDNPVQDAKRITLYKDHPGVQAPSVIEFDNDGNYIQGWGGPDWVPQAAKGRKVPDDYRWFNDEHGILADQEGHIWVSGHTWAGDVAGPGPDLIDTHLLEFTHDGKFLMMIGHPHSWGGSNDKMNVGNTTTMALDTKANELYAADGEGNHRVIVFDAKKGTYKRLRGSAGRQTRGGRRRRKRSRVQAIWPSISALHSTRQGWPGVRVRPRKLADTGVSQGRNICERGLCRERDARPRVHLVVGVLTGQQVPLRWRRNKYEDLVSAVGHIGSCGIVRR